MDPTSAFIFVAWFAGSGESGARAAVVPPTEASRVGLARFAEPGDVDDFRAGGIGVTPIAGAVARSAVARSASAKSAAAFSARRRRSESNTRSECGADDSVARGSTRASSGETRGPFFGKSQSSRPTLRSSCAATSQIFGLSVGFGARQLRMSALARSLTRGASGKAYAFARIRLYVACTSDV